MNVSILHLLSSYSMILPCSGPLSHVFLQLYVLQVYLHAHRFEFWKFSFPCYTSSTATYKLITCKLLLFQYHVKWVGLCSAALCSSIHGEPNHYPDSVKQPYRGLGEQKKTEVAAKHVFN